MTAENLATYIKEPKALSKKEFINLKKLIKEYPYFQTAHALLLKSAKNTGGANLETTLHNSAAFVADRQVLYNFLSDEKQDKGKQKGRSQTVAMQTLADRQAKTVSPTKKETKEPVNKTVEIKKPVAKVIVKKRPVKIKELKKEPLIQKNVTSKTENISPKEKHETIIQDFFAVRTRPTNNAKDENKKKKTIINEEDKKKITDDIFAKIEALKKEKPLAVKTTSKPIESRKIEREKNVVTENIKKSKPVEAEKIQGKKSDKVRKVVIITEKKTIKPEEKKEEKKITAADNLLNRISAKTENAKTEVKKPIVVIKEKAKEVQLSTPEKKEVVKKIEATPEKIKNKEEVKKPTVSELISKFAGGGTSTEKKKDVKKPEVKPIVKEAIIAPEIKKEPLKKEEPKTNKGLAADSLMARIAAMRKKKEEAQGDTTENNNNLINKFVEEQPSLNTEKEPEITGDAAESSTVEQGEVITELMASIYINQGHTDKAILVYEKLSLKNPEKKSYFANLISELKEDENK